MSHKIKRDLDIMGNPRGVWKLDKGSVEMAISFCVKKRLIPFKKKWDIIEEFNAEWETAERIFKAAEKEREQFEKELQKKYNRTKI